MPKHTPGTLNQPSLMALQRPPCQAEPTSGAQLHKPGNEPMVDCAISMSVEECVCAGYCSLVHFSEGDLGTPLAADKVPAHIQPLMKAAAKAAACLQPQSSWRLPRLPGKPSRRRKLAQQQSRNRLSAPMERAPCRPSPWSDPEPKQAAAPAGPSGRPEAGEQHIGEQEPAGSQPAQVDLTDAAQERPSQASTPLPEPAHPEPPSAQKRQLTEAPLRQPEQTGAGSSWQRCEEAEAHRPHRHGIQHFQLPRQPGAVRTLHRACPLLMLPLVMRMSCPQMLPSGS